MKMNCLKMADHFLEKFNSKIENMRLIEIDGNI